MSRFNAAAPAASRTTNFAGGEAFVQSPKLEFVSILLTSFATDGAYRSADDTIARLVALIDQIPDKEFIAKAAVYARRQFGMRSITHVVAAELAKRVKGEAWMKRFLEMVVYRPDDASEILAYWLGKYGKPIPNALKKGLGLGLAKFDAYALGKYRGEGKSVKLVDLLNLVHAKPTDRSSEAFTALANGTLRSVDTWESELTKAGQNAEGEEDLANLKADAWISLLAEKKLKYFALLRNLRNIVTQAPQAVDEACRQLVDEEAIRKSLVLPFRFLAAMAEIEKLPGTTKVIQSLAVAVDLAMQNVPTFGGRTLVALDVSGSMTMAAVAKSKVSVASAGAVFAAALVKSNHADLITFDTSARYITLNPLDSVFGLVRQIPFPGGGTDFHTIFKTASRPYDRIIILSDMQGWVGRDNPSADFHRYRSRLKCEPKVYSIDLAGLGTMQLPERNVYALAGFSDKVFDLMKIMEEDPKALMGVIDLIRFDA